MPAMWNATTPTGSFVVIVWYGTTSQRAIAFASAPGPVPTTSGCAVGAVKPSPGTRSGIEPGGAGVGGGGGGGTGPGAGGAISAAIIVFALLTRGSCSLTTDCARRDERAPAADTSSS